MAVTQRRISPRPYKARGPQKPRPSRCKLKWLRGLATNIICSCGDRQPELRATLSERAPQSTRRSLPFRINGVQDTRVRQNASFWAVELAAEGGGMFANEFADGSGRPAREIGDGVRNCHGFPAAR